MTRLTKNCKQLRFFQHQFVCTSSLYWRCYTVQQSFFQTGKTDTSQSLKEKVTKACTFYVTFHLSIVFYSVLHKPNVKLNVFQNKTFFIHRVFIISEVFTLLPKQCISRLYVGIKLSHSKSTSV